MYWQPRRRRAVLYAGCFVLAACSSAVAQPPLPALPSGGNLARLPNDQVEGAIWEYRGTPKFRPKDDEKVPKIDGRFRVEKTAIFEVSRKLKLPGRKQVREAIGALRSEEGAEIGLPEGSKPKRIGEFSPLSKTRLRFELDDGKDLHGIMVVQRKSRSLDSWIGEYTEFDGKKKTGRQWQVELRTLED
jgi:hypothetical protein